METQIEMLNSATVTVSLSLELDCAFLKMSTWLWTIYSSAQVLQQVLTHGKEGLHIYRSAAVLP